MKNVLKIQGIHTDRETGHPTLKKGKLNLVDLAGSERHGKTGGSREFPQKRERDLQVIRFE